MNDELGGLVMNDEMPRHPEAQTMAAFVDGTLAREEIAAVAGHLRECADCRLVVTETARFEREEARVAPRRSWWLALAAAVAALAIGALIASLLIRRASPIHRLIAAAPRQHRFVEARLSGFPWAQLQAPSRGEAKPDPADLKLAGAAGDVLDTTAERSDPTAEYARGVAYLVIGRRSDGIASLEAAAAHSTDPRTWNDLAAARYAAATNDERPSQLPEALAAADHALRLDPNFAEARFNRALILERLGLLDHARNAWRSYLALDPDSAWSIEARAHLQKLQPASRRFDPKLLEVQPAEQLVREFPEEARRWGEAVLLGNWADAEVAREPARAAAILTRARDLGNALAKTNGEHLLEDTVAAIDHASGGTRATLAQGHQQYRAARIDYSKRRSGAAETGFRNAETLFARGGSQMAAVASYFAASAAFDQQRTGEAHDELTQILAVTDATRHRALAAQLHWELAVCANSEGDWGAAARESAAAATIFRALGERGNAAIVDGIATMALELIGATDLAWGRRVQTFAQLSANGEQQKLAAILHSASATLASLDRTAAAGSVLDLARESGGADPAQRAIADADRARIAMRNGDVEVARSVLTSARGEGARISDAALHEIAGAQIDLAEASVDASRAIPSLDRSIAFFTRRGMSVDLADAYLQRARALRAAHDENGALADYGRALTEIGKQRATIRDAESRLRFLDVAGRVREETIDLRLTRGDAVGAFNVSDRAAQIPAVPASAAIVEYAVLPHAVAAFVVTPAGVVAHRTKIDRHELEARVTSFADRIRRRAPLAEIDSDGAALYRLLLEPIEPQLAGVRELVVVPDRLLYALPFGALRGKQQYLLERFPMRVAASAGWSSDESAALAPALVVADPPTPSWPRLPASRDEATHIAALHGATLLTGDEATRSAFTAATRGSALIHFTGHANSDAGTSYAALLLAANANDSGVLGATDIARLRLDRHPLVVLAACGTFRGDTLHVAGMSSLARAFLLAGARSVIGTLWEIDDDVSASLFLRLHQHLRDGMPPAHALREAQLDLFHSTDLRLAHPATWAPAETITTQPGSQPER